MYRNMVSQQPILRAEIEKIKSLLKNTELVFYLCSMLLMSGKNHRCLRQQRIVMERWVFENLGFGSDLELTLVFSSFFFEFG